VYTLTNKPNGVLYVGMTNELDRRITEHKTKQIKGFTYKYNVDQLVYFEEFETYHEAFQKERQMKKWKRDWKVELIENKNPEWKDLANSWY
jgi:putative endonuclease